jgi:hypothetical protein
MPPALLALWDGPRWRWWTLLVGVVLVPLSVSIGALIALALGQDTIALIMLILMVELLIVSVIGSGLLDSMSRRMSRGGLARETFDLDELNRRLGKTSEEDEEAEQARRDRRTIRAGLLALPIMSAFGYLLFFS